MVRALFRLFATVPLPIAHALGATLGLIAAIVPNSFARRTRFHISRCMPELGPRERRRLAFRALIESGKALAELPLLFAGSAARVPGWLRDVRGRELLDAAVAAGKGVIAASPHLGSWEMAGLAYSRLQPIVTMYRPQAEPWDTLIKEGRSRFGAQVVPSDRGGMRRLLETLRRGGSIGVLPDQDPPTGSGTFAPFFGIAAHSPVFASRLARRTGAAILYVYAERLSWGRGYVLHIDPAPPDVTDEDEVRAVTAVNRGVEACIRQFPAQYYWAYMRFRRRPAGEPAFYPW
ncbi:MAG TPA: lysophospholipid acyltransferase family protein [Burkholderiales bacterium]|nr:lysophospholipid acyltransferase family protein [Burkholderiales bacterium]